MRIIPSVMLCGLAAALGATAAAPDAALSKRVIYYYQTQYDNGVYVSLSPMWTTLDPKDNKPYVTDVMVAAFHLGYDSNGAPYIHLNDNVPSDPMFTTMWQEVATLQSYGVTVRMMLGGAAQGSYADLFNNWSTFYPILQQTLQQYNLNGIDLDIEESVSLANAEMLINQLDTDFGSKFLITMAPVASALWGGANLSGFSYPDLYKSSAGAKIAWFNGQFYSGFATLSSPADYERVVSFGYPANKIVAGMIANSADGSGYVNMEFVSETVGSLVAKYPHFGGVFAWEYFNAEPGGVSDPIKWAVYMAKSMR
ncbi:MAG: chitinase [Bryobacteraceae bacterium]